MVTLKGSKYVDKMDQNDKIQISNECQMTKAKKRCPPPVIQPILVDTDKGQKINNYSVLNTFGIEVLDLI